MPAVNFLDSKIFWSLLYVLITVFLLFSFSLSDTYQSNIHKKGFFLQFHTTEYQTADSNYLKCIEKIPQRKHDNSHTFLSLKKEFEADLQEMNLCPVPSTTYLAPEKIIFNLFVFSFFPAFILFLLLMKREHSHNK